MQLWLEFQQKSYDTEIENLVPFKMKFKVGIIGSFANGTQSMDGQTVKTKSVSALLKKMYSEECICEVDTFAWSKNPFKLFIGIIKVCRNCENVIMLPAQNALRVIPLFVLLFKKTNTKVFYSVIGGWLPKLMKNNNFLRSILKKLNGIWVETATMENSLMEQGLENVTIVNNFKNFKSIVPINDFTEPYKLCIFSRIMEQKGIEDAINAIKEINQSHGIKFILDIYGMIDNSYKERFNHICQSLPGYIKYCGCVDSSLATETLKNYYALLFPTKFYTEGIPGTIIDAYSAGVPVLSSRWQSFNDVIDEGITGFGYDFNNYEAFKNLLLSILSNKIKLSSLRTNCIKKSLEYSEDIVGAQILDLLDTK